MFSLIYYTQKLKKNQVYLKKVKEILKKVLTKRIKYAKLYT